MDRIAEIKRVTGETDIQLKFNVDGQGKSKIDTGIPFLNHMLTLFAKHGFFDLRYRLGRRFDLEWEAIYRHVRYGRRMRSYETIPLWAGRVWKGWFI